MAKRITFLALLLVFTSVTTGCVCFNDWVHRPFGPGTLCRTDNCGCGDCGGGDCGGGDCGSCAPCGEVVEAGCGACAGDCEPACGEACGPPCGPPCAPCFRPLAWVGALLHPPTWYGPTCGEVYWGDFHSDPPDCCDPCDRCGNHTGGSAGVVVQGGTEVIDSGCNCGKATQQSPTVAKRRVGSLE